MNVLVFGEPSNGLDTKLRTVLKFGVRSMEYK